VNLDADLKILASQENQLIFNHFDEAAARELGDLIIEKAKATGQIITVLIRIAGSPVFLQALPGTAPANFQWATRKANLTELYGQSSYRLGQQNKRSDIDVIARSGLSLSDYASHGGCFPIRLHGVGLIGSATVSGLPQREDHILISAAIAEFLRVDLPQLS
jgi:uncharacterized protein (UPF0303 family)